MANALERTNVLLVVFHDNVGLAVLVVAKTNQDDITLINLYK